MDKFLKALSESLTELHRNTGKQPNKIDIELGDSLWYQLVQGIIEDRRFDSSIPLKDSILYRMPVGGLTVHFTREPHVCNCKHCTRN